MVTDLIILLIYLAAFNGALLLCYGIVRLWFRATGRDWIDYQ